MYFFHVTTSIRQIIFFNLAVRCMMYGFGDDQAPFTESVDLLEDLVVEYISEMVIWFS